MATIADLHLSISDMSDEDLFVHIRHLRSLRREILIRSSTKKIKKSTIKQTSIEDYLSKISRTKKDEIIKSLLKIKGK